MATNTIPWNDGTGQSLYLSTDSGAAGTTTVSVTADKSASTSERSKTITVTNGKGTTVDVTIKQTGSKYVKTYKNSVMTLILTSQKTVTYVPNHNMTAVATILNYNPSTGAETYVAQFKVNKGATFVYTLPAGAYSLYYSGYTTSNIINAIVE